VPFSNPLCLWLLKSWFPVAWSPQCFVPPKPCRVLENSSTTLPLLQYSLALGRKGDYQTRPFGRTIRDFSWNLFESIFNTTHSTLWVLMFYIFGDSSNMKQCSQSTYCICCTVGCMGIRSLVLLCTLLEANTTIRNTFYWWIYADNCRPSRMGGVSFVLGIPGCSQFFLLWIVVMNQARGISTPRFYGYSDIEPH